MYVKKRFVWRGIIYGQFCLGSRWLKGSWIIDPIRVLGCLLSWKSMDWKLANGGSFYLVDLIGDFMPSWVLLDGSLGLANQRFLLLRALFTCEHFPCFIFCLLVHLSFIYCKTSIVVNKNVWGKKQSQPALDHGCCYAFYYFC